MLEAPAYLVVGRGRWAALIREILLKINRHTTILAETRLTSGEPNVAYQKRLERAMTSSGAAIVWLCVPFGPWILTMATAAMNAGLDVVAECPWLLPEKDSETLSQLQQKAQRVLGVHYEYCLLDQVQGWRQEFGGGESCTFNGIFELARAGRHALAAELQLGSHLLAIQRYAVPQATIGQIRCHYQTEDKRMAWLTKNGVEVSRMSFANNRQPLIQRYISIFEKERVARNMTFGLDFARQIATDAFGLLGGQGLAKL